VNGPRGNLIITAAAFLTVRGDVQARAGAESLGYSSPVPRGPGVRKLHLVLTGALPIFTLRTVPERSFGH
jgi:hypothetical protein